MQGPGVSDLDYPFASDEEAGGDALYAVFPGYSAVLVQHGGKRQTRFLGISLHGSPAFTNIHGQEDEPLVAVLFVGFLQSGPLATAVRSPGGPEVEEHHLAS